MIFLDFIHNYIDTTSLGKIYTVICTCNLLAFKTICHEPFSGQFNSSVSLFLMPLWHFILQAGNNLFNQSLIDGHSSCF